MDSCRIGRTSRPLQCGSRSPILLRQAIPPFYKLNPRTCCTPSTFPSSQRNNSQYCTAYHGTAPGHRQRNNSTQHKIPAIAYHTMGPSVKPGSATTKFSRPTGLATIIYNGSPIGITLYPAILRFPDRDTGLKLGEQHYRHIVLKHYNILRLSRYRYTVYSTTILCALPHKTLSVYTHKTLCALLHKTVVLYEHKTICVQQHKTVVLYNNIAVSLYNYITI